MNREKLINEAVYLIIKDGRNSDKCYPPEYGLHETLIFGDDVIENRCSMEDYNFHHYLPKYYYKKVIPALAAMLDFPYSKDDFYLNKKIIKYNSGSIDFSYFTPVKDNMEFTIKYFKLNPAEGGLLYQTMNEKICKFDEMCCVDETFNENMLENLNGAKFSFYHKIFIGAHNCVRIENNSLKNGRAIIISADSHSIPIVPILCCYYQTVVVLDNRNFIGEYDYLTSDIEEAQSLFIMSEKNNYDKWFIQNLQ